MSDTQSKLCDFCGQLIIEHRYGPGGKILYLPYYTNRGQHELTIDLHCNCFGAAKRLLDRLDITDTFVKINERNVKGDVA